MDEMYFWSCPRCGASGWVAEPEEVDMAVLIHIATMHP